MNTSPQPLTAFLESTLKAPVAIRPVTKPDDRPLTPEELGRLRAGGLTAGRWRKSLLYVGGTLAASATLLWLPPRLPAVACQALDAGLQPAGRILEPYGVRRVDCRAMDATGIEEVSGKGAAVIASAVLVIRDGDRVAIAEEIILASFAETLASAMRALARHRNREARHRRAHQTA